MRCDHQAVLLPRLVHNQSIEVGYIGVPQQVHHVCLRVQHLAREPPKSKQIRFGNVKLTKPDPTAKSIKHPLPTSLFEAKMSVEQFQGCLEGGLGVPTCEFGPENSLISA